MDGDGTRIPDFETMSTRGIQINSREEAAAYAAEVASRDGKVLLEERISGEEFSLQVFSDGRNVSPMPLAQDYKRALEGYTGCLFEYIGAQDSWNRESQIIWLSQLCLNKFPRTDVGGSDQGNRGY